MTIDNSNDLRRPKPSDDLRRNEPVRNELQADPELQEGPAGAGRIAIYAVAIAVLLGAVFFGLNSSPTTTATGPSSATTADNAPTASPAAPAAVRDVTPNRQPGMTTGAAPAQPIQPPQAGPVGTQIDTSKAPANN